MKKIGFIGAFDKTDLILYVSKILVETGKTVLVIDTTMNQRARYIVPAISPSVCYVTEYEGIDVAVGFDNTEKICQYLGTEKLNYDILILDIDSNENFIQFDMTAADKNFFVTGFDSYSLKKGLEIIGQMENKIKMTKILFSRDMLKEEDDYLNFLSFYFSVEWEKEKMYFPYDQGDNTVIIENQRAAQIRFKDLSSEYKESLLLVSNLISPEIKNGDLKKAFKKI